MSDILTAPPTVEPLTLQQAKDHLGISGTDHDTRVTRLIAKARAHVEKVTGRALVLQSRRLYLDAFPDDQLIEIFHAPLLAVQSVKYLDDAGDTQTLATTQYRVDRYSLPPRITAEYNITWPTTRGVENSVWVDYTAGYLIPFTADTTTDVLTAAGHGFSDTDVSQVMTLAGVLPTGLSATTNYYVRDATANTLKLSATSGGSAIDITGAGTVPNVLGRVPEDLVHAMELLVGHWNENREAVLVGSISGEIGFAVADLLAPYKITRC